MEYIIREIYIMKMDVVVLTETKRREQEVKHWKLYIPFQRGEEI